MEDEAGQYMASLEIFKVVWAPPHVSAASPGLWGLHPECHPLGNACICS